MPDVRTAHRPVLVLSLAAALAAAVPARARPDEARIAVVADPRVLSPGERQVSVRVEGCEGEPRVSASVGTVTDVRSVAPGRTVAAYVPPAEARPQVAIVTSECGGSFGWTAIPIVGRGIAIAHTEPGAAIRVTIGARSYGPAVADAEGAARVTVDVPPGVRFAYQGERPLDLHVPPAPHAHVVVDPPALRADRAGEARVLAFAVTDEGLPRARAPLRLSASSGALTDAEEIEPGVVRARWTGGAGAAGRVRIEARLEDDPGPAGAAEIEREPGPPARLETAADRARAVAGEPPVRLDVAVRDAAGNLADGELRVDPPEVVVDRRAVERGRWALGLQVPERLGGRSSLSISLAAGEATAAATVALAAAPAATLAVEPAPREVVADGRAAVPYRVALRDRFGNASLDAPPSARTVEASEVATALDGDGFVVTVRPRRRSAPAEDVVTITGAGRTERLPLALRAPEPMLALAVRAGAVAARGGARSPYVGAEAILWASRHLGAAIEAGALGLERSESVPLAAGGMELEGDVHYLPVAASLRWRAARTPRTFLVAGAGAVLSMVSAEVRVARQPVVRENGRAAGAQLSFGAGWRLGPGALLVEARALWLADPGLDAVRGRLLVAGLVAGWSHGVF